MESIKKINKAVFARNLRKNAPKLNQYLEDFWINHTSPEKFGDFGAWMGGRKAGCSLGFVEG